MPNIDIAWWNLENLFDHENAGRPAELASKIRSELVGWSVAVRDQKIDQLASVIELMFDGAGPDLLGVCEVENEEVLHLLVNRINLPARNYRVVGHASPDARGIDVSFIVDDNILSIDHTDHQVVVKRSATRDVFWAEFMINATGSVFLAIANHWPSRTAGRYESAPYRILTGETVSYVISQLFEEFDVGNRLPVVVMGDFNDEPFDRSMQEYLLGSRDAGRVTRARSPKLLNLMWPLMSGRNPGTYRYGSDWNMLDQFLVTKGMLLSDSPIRAQLETVSIFRPGVILGRSGRPRRFGRPSSKGFDQDGFSDHFPILMTLRAI